MFGEGITVIGRRLYQLTWRHERGYIYDAASLTPLDSFAYASEGWGLATNGRRLYLSDGTSRVRVIDPTTFRVERTFQVREADRPVWLLNELEWVDGELWANVFRTDLIARIDPDSGRVLGWVDVSGLLTRDELDTVRRRGGVPNGIAYDAMRRRVLITGKFWPRMFEVDLGQARGAVPADPASSPPDV